MQLSTGVLSGPRRNFPWTLRGLKCTSKCQKSEHFHASSSLKLSSSTSSSQPFETLLPAPPLLPSHPPLRHFVSMAMFWIKFRAGKDPWNDQNFVKSTFEETTGLLCRLGLQKQIKTVSLLFSFAVKSMESVHAVYGETIEIPCGFSIFEKPENIMMVKWKYVSHIGGQLRHPTDTLSWWLSHAQSGCTHVSACVWPSVWHWVLLLKLQPLCLKSTLLLSAGTRNGVFKRSDCQTNR